LATTAWATSTRLSAAEYASFARPSDLRLLRKLAKAEFNVLHVCRAHNLLKPVADYPVHAFSWDPRAAGNVSLAEGKALLGGKTVIGGLPHDSRLKSSSTVRLAGEVTGLRAALGEKGWILGPGCTFPGEVPVRNLRAVRSAVDTEVKK
jgi:uroporphyrinogen decarboxylase